MLATLFCSTRTTMETLFQKNSKRICLTLILIVSLASRNSNFKFRSSLFITDHWSLRHWSLITLHFRISATRPWTSLSSVMWSMGTNHHPRPQHVQTNRNWCRNTPCPSGPSVSCHPLQRKRPFLFLRKSGRQECRKRYPGDAVRKINPAFLVRVGGSWPVSMLCFPSLLRCITIPLLKQSRRTKKTRHNVQQHKPIPLSLP